MKNRIVITGTNGFVGSNLVKCPYWSGYRNLVLINRRPNKESKNPTTTVGNFSDTNVE